jgi:peptidase inhibitor family I36
VIAMQLRSRVAGVAAAVMMGASNLSLLGALPAAASPYQGCFDGEWCIYEDVDFHGDNCGWQGNVSDYTTQRGRIFGINCNDIMSAYVNNGHGNFSWIRVFKHVNYSDSLRIVPPIESGFGDATSSWVGGINDRASSHTWGNP